MESNKTQVIHPFTILVAIGLVLFFSPFEIVREFTTYQPRRHSPQHARRVFSGRYLLTSAIGYGRLSNAKLSVTELLGLSLALNRTAVIPPIDSCTQTSTDFLSLFDAAALPVAAVPLHAFDFDSACGGSEWLYVDAGHPVLVEEGSVFRGRLPIRVHSPPAETLLYGLESASMAMEYTCIVLTKHFRAVDWAACGRPEVGAAVHTNLLPQYAIAAEAQSFIARNNLISRAFVGVHLRLTDMTAINSSFGRACNHDAESLLGHVHAALAGASHGRSRGAIVLGTDDYEAPCAQALQRAFTQELFVLLRATNFPRGSCEEALFEQEVLGHADFFIGDALSTYSLSISNIRQHRMGFSAKTSVLLFGEGGAA